MSDQPMPSIHSRPNQQQREQIVGGIADAVAAPLESVTADQAKMISSVLRHAENDRVFVSPLTTFHGKYAFGNWVIDYQYEYPSKRSITINGRSYNTTDVDFVKYIKVKSGECTQEQADEIYDKYRPSPPPQS